MEVAESVFVCSHEVLRRQLQRKNKAFWFFFRQGLLVSTLGQMLNDQDLRAALEPINHFGDSGQTQG